MIQRFLEPIIKKSLFKKKVILLLGARQTGKTTLLKLISSQYENVLWLNGDELDIQKRLNNSNSIQLKSLIGNAKMIVIDEAQRIDNIGLSLKIIHDNFPDVQVIATGSSAFELKNKVSEPLTGRKVEFYLFPISYAEMCAHHSAFTEERSLSDRLIFGSYPEIITTNEDKVITLKSLADSYLFRDILMLESVKKPEKLIKLLQALAFQIGSEVSYNEIGNLIGLDSKTIETYISLLEKSFVIFKLGSFSRNLRNELKQSKKIFFYDTGIRNALISNFQLFEGRQDIGALFENYLIVERLKLNQYTNQFANSYFWRTKEQQEIDYIEEKNGIIEAFEFKWNPEMKVKFTTTFSNAYPNTKMSVVNSDNFGTFLIC
jgi:uncharacterized protein